MEVVGEGEWGSSLNSMCSDEGDFMAQLLGNCSFSNDTNFVVSPAFWPTSHESMSIGVADHDQAAAMYNTNEANIMSSFSQGSSFSSGVVQFPFSTQETYYSSTLSHSHHNNNNLIMPMDYCNDNVMMPAEDDHDFLNRDVVSNDSTETKNQTPQITSPNSDNSKKRSRIPCDVPRSKKSIKFNKCPKFDESDEDNNNNNDNNNNDNNNNNNNNNRNNSNSNAVVIRRQSSSSYCSEDESNEYEMNMNGTTSCSSSRTGKTRASRGSATDPQSLYARKRRERINERLRILQTLVPNGTKVDISTMLEEAVEYVKFLQLQIKLLSSDDLWMYAPIAYNGMDIGLDLKISSLTPKS